MIIRVDEEGHKKLLQVLDVFIKSSGLQGTQLLNEIGAAVEIIETSGIAKDIKEAKPEMKVEKK